jgi:GDP-L-fucose synthase
MKNHYFEYQNKKLCYQLYLKFIMPQTTVKKDNKIFIAGHNGMVGSSIVRKYRSEGYNNLIFANRQELDLRNQNNVNTFFQLQKPTQVIIAAAKVGGILANSVYRAEFIYDNLIIASNLIHASFMNKVDKLLFLGSSCIYPKFAPQPLKEEYLLTNELEPTNEPYAIAKIAGIKLCESYFRQYGCNYFSIMPTNLYGPNDNYDKETSHVLPALINKFHEAKTNKLEDVVIWGSGRPLREFLYVDDLANAVFFLMNNINANQIYNLGISHLNVGFGEDISIGKLAELIRKLLNVSSRIVFDSSKPDGTPRKLLDSSRLINLGWKPGVNIEDGIIKSYKWFLENNRGME